MKSFRAQSISYVLVRFLFVLTVVFTLWLAGLLIAVLVAHKTLWLEHVRRAHVCPKNAGLSSCSPIGSTIIRLTTAFRWPYVRLGGTQVCHVQVVGYHYLKLPAVVFSELNVSSVQNLKDLALSICRTDSKLRPTSSAC